MRAAGITCAKNEGPFLVEWIAYHRLIGFTDIIVFTNDCTDGTDAIADRLDEMGLIRHLPNPRHLNPRLRFQKAALEYAMGLGAVRNADWIMSFDSDEFVNVDVGAGMLSDLIGAYPGAELISICQLQHGCSHRVAYEEGLSIELFQLSQKHEARAENPRRRDAERGLKTLIHRDAPMIEINNHKPVIAEDRRHDVRWLYGEGQRVGPDVIGEGSKSLPVQGCYAKGSLNHYATRSIESFLVQSHRGNAVKLDERADVRYWKRYNHNAMQNGTITRHAPALRDMLDDWYADPALKERQSATNAHHRAMIARLKEEPFYKSLFQTVHKLDQQAIEQGVAA